MTSIRAYLWRSGATGLVNTIASGVSVAFLLPLIIHRVGLEAYGFFSMLGLFVGIAALLELGMCKALVYLTPRNAAALPEFFSGALLICGTGVALFLSATLLLLTAGVPLLGVAAHASGDLAWWLYAGGSCVVVCNVATALIRGALEGSLKMHWVNLGFAALTFTNYLVVFVVSLVTNDPRHLIAASALVFVAMLIGHGILAHRALGLRWIRPRKETLQTLRRVGAKSLAADAPGALQAPALQFLLAQSTTSSADYGLFDLATRIATLCASALSGLSTAFMALVAGANRESAASVRRAIARHVRFTLTIAICGWLVFALIGPNLIQIVIPLAPLSMFHATLIILGGAAMLAALEPWARMQLGLGRQSSVALVRCALLAASLTVAIAPIAMPPLLKFASASAIGFLVACAGLAFLHWRESWGRTDIVP